MHEYAVTRQILEIVLEEADAAGVKRVEHVHLTLGKLRGFAPEPIRMYFEIYAKETPAQNARLTFREIPARFRCKHCSREFQLDEPVFLCPDCGSFQLEKRSGDEFTIDNIEGT